MENLKKLVDKIGLVVNKDNEKLKGHSCNISSWPIFRLWINKMGNLTVKTRGVQKSFKEWKDVEDFKNILQGFEII